MLCFLFVENSLRFRYFKVVEPAFQVRLEFSVSRLQPSNLRRILHRCFFLWLSKLTGERFNLLSISLLHLRHLTFKLFFFFVVGFRGQLQLLTEFSKLSFVCFGHLLELYCELLDFLPRWLLHGFQLLSEFVAAFTLFLAAIFDLFLKLSRLILQFSDRGLHCLVVFGVD